MFISEIFRKYFREVLDGVCRVGFEFCDILGRGD